MSFIIPTPTTLQTDIDFLNNTLETAIISINASANLMYDFYNTLWTTLPDSQLSAVLQYMYDNNSLFFVLSSNVRMAKNINDTLSAWSFNGRYLQTLSAGRNFYIDNNTVILLSS